MKFLDLFAGIGGFRMGMEQAGHECIGYVEMDKYARMSYEAIHDTKGEYTGHDITKISDNEFKQLRGSVDVICGGFPCQAFSVAGKRGGFSDTRGTLFFDIARAAEQIKPSILLLENVKGLLSHDKGKTFITILNTLDELGYDAEWQVINSKDYGVPQNRERVFIIGHLRGSGGREVFPIERENKTTVIADVIGLDDQGRTTKKLKPLSVWPTLRRESHGNEPKVVIPVLTPDRLNKRQNGRRFKEHEEPMFTLTAQDRHGIAITEGLPIREATKKGYAVAQVGDSVNYAVPTSKTRRGRVGKGIANTLDTGCQQGVVTEDIRIRRLTPKECWRLQGFPDWAFHKAEEVNSDSQLYKQAGNAVTVNVVYEIAKRL